MSNYLLLGMFVIIIIHGFFNKVNLYDSFVEGTKQSIKTIGNMFSTLVSFFIALSFLFSSGIIDYIESIVSFKYSIILIQCLVRPISSSSSMSIMLECYSLYGSDHIISIISTLIHYVSDASIYIITFYFGMYKINELDYVLKYGLIINIFSYIVSIAIIYLYMCII